MPRGRVHFFKQSSLKQVPDNELIHSFKETGDPAFIGELFSRYTHLVFGVCMKYLKDEEDAKDAVMEIMEDLFDDLKIHAIDNFKSWLYTVAKNHCLMEIRKNASVHMIREVSSENFPPEFMESLLVMHPDNDEAEDHSHEKMTKALHMLNQEQRTCIELLYLHDKSYKEVVEMTGFTMKQVKSHIQNGRRNLKILLTR
jgi:RNA polymerase sigma-70 factor (ECF subfamily)